MTTEQTIVSDEIEAQKKRILKHVSSGPFEMEVVKKELDILEVMAKQSQHIKDHEMINRKINEVF